MYHIVLVQDNFSEHSLVSTSDLYYTQKIQIIKDSTADFLLCYFVLKTLLYLNLIIMTSQPAEKSSRDKFLDAIQPFWIGGLSGMIATCVIQPVDMIKVVIQLQSEKGQKATFGSALKDIMTKDGIRGFYRGIDSALTRQIFYTTTRLGIYKKISEFTQENNKKNGQNALSFFQKAYCAAFAGFIGSLFGNPPDLALVRMQADNQLPVEERRNYKNVFDAFARITKEQGVLGLWTGATPTIIRAVVLNLAMLASYDQVKEQLLPHFENKETLPLRVIASMVSGFASSFCSLPFDNAKTKLQKMKKGPDGQYPYKHIFDAMFKTIQREGFTHLWVGYLTFYVRIAPHVAITLLTQDFLTEHVKRWRKGAH